MFTVSTHRHPCLYHKVASVWLFGSYGKCKRVMIKLMIVSNYVAWLVGGLVGWLVNL